MYMPTQKILWSIYAVKVVVLQGSLNFSKTKEKLSCNYKPALISMRKEFGA